MPEDEICSEILNYPRTKRDHHNETMPVRWAGWWMVLLLLSHPHFRFPSSPFSVALCPASSRQGDLHWWRRRRGMK